MLPKKLFLIMIGVYQVCFAIGLEELIFYSTGVAGVVAVPGLQWLLTRNKNVDSLGGCVAFKKKYEDAKRPLPESMKDLNEMSCDRLIQCLDEAIGPWKIAFIIIYLLQLSEKEKIANTINYFCNNNKFCLLKVEKKAKKELGEEVLDILIEKCAYFCKNNEALLAQCELFGASNLGEFCTKYKPSVECSLRLLNFKVETNKRASGRKKDSEEEAIDLEEKANEKQVLTIKKELLDILHKCYCDSIKNVTSVLNVWCHIVAHIDKQRKEWLSNEGINETEKNNIKKMSLFDWVWYLQYKSFCQSNEKSDYWRNYMKRFLPPIIFLDGIVAILIFCFLGLSKTNLSVWILLCGALHGFFNLMYYSLNSVDELTSFQNGSRKLFFDMLKEEGKKMKKRGRERVS